MYDWYKKYIVEAVKRVKSFFRDEDIVNLVFAKLLLLKDGGQLHEVSPFEKRDMKKQLDSLRFSIKLSAETKEILDILVDDLMFSRTSNDLLQTHAVDNLLVITEEMAKAAGVPEAVKSILYILSQELSFQYDQGVPSEMAELIGRLCGIEKTVAKIWNPYCGLGLLLSDIEVDELATIMGTEQNRIMSFFARIYFYLRTGKVLRMENEDPINKKVKEGYDLILSAIPFGPQGSYDGVNDEVLKPLKVTRRYGESISIWNLCQRLKQGGKAVLLIPNGVLFRSGNDYELRKLLICNGWLKDIIYFPSRMLLNTSIPCSIVIIQKAENGRKGIRVIDVESNPDWYISGRQNRLTQLGIQEICSIINENTQERKGVRILSDDRKSKDYRLDRQSCFGEDNCGKRDEKQTKELRREAEKALLAFQDAHEELMVLIRNMQS